MSDPARPEAGDPIRRMQKPDEPYLRGAGASPSAGTREPLPSQAAEPVLRPMPAPLTRAGVKTAARPSSAAQPSGFQRALDLVRGVLPVVQKVLPLLDGNVASAVSNILAPHPQSSQPASLAPIENALDRIQLEHRAMRTQMAEQNSSLQRVADQLEKVKEATDRNTLEQQELMDDLQRIRKRMKTYAWIGIGLLTAALALNVILFLRIQHILP